MLKRCTKLATVLLFTVVGLSFAQITTSSAIYPHYNSSIMEDSIIKPGENFWVDIKVANVSSLFGTSFKLNYNSTYFSVFAADSIIQGDFLGADLVFTGTQGTGNVSIGVSQKSGASGADGDGTVARVKFTASGSTPVLQSQLFTLTNVVSTDPSGSDITLTPLDYYIWVAGISVWPGDANNDNSVDQTDILPLGTYWNNTGAARSGASRSWTEQQAAPWTPEAATSADCDGTGLVDQADILPIGLNWGNSHVLLAGSNPYPELPGAMLQAYVAPFDTENGLTALTISIGPEYGPQFRGVSFALTASPGVEISAIEKGTAWSEQALFYSRENNGVWGVAVTELGSRVLDRPTGGELFRVVFKNLDDGSGAPVTITNLRASLTDGQIVGVADPTAGLFASGAAGPSLPRAFSLSQNSPNPFNPSTTISYAVPDGEAVAVTLKVFDIRGRLVRTLAEGVKQPGAYSVQWNGTDTSGRQVASGIYFYRLTAGAYVSTRKMVLVK